MRIISGKLRGRQITPPADRKVRPTSDKVKEAVFSMIAEYMGEDSVCVDLFSGTGNLGLEAVSRGAKIVYFGDKSKESIQLTRANISTCKAEEQAVVIHGDFSQVLKRIQGQADIFFLDPPYKDNLLLSAMELIQEKGLLSQGGIIVAEHDKKEILPEELGGLRKIKEKRYGGIGVTVYEQE